jgi:hypothetical protein
MEEHLKYTVLSLFLPLSIPVAFSTSTLVPFSQWIQLCAFYTTTWGTSNPKLSIKKLCDFEHFALYL